ncbi:hypothetical protein [Plantibacter sp. YIM 135249]|uniref:DUF7882 family protein n=1 Tax=Plantibacter sp. YIM 135249 TaxID=3423918 RepID=UPI003D329D91
MGRLIYGSSARELELDDRTLAHVKSIAVMKLRRNESFTVSWQRSEDAGGGRVSIWMHPSISLQFEFDDATRPELNRTWLESMMQDANKSGDLHIGPELDASDAQPVAKTARTSAAKAAKAAKNAKTNATAKTAGTSSTSTAAP